ncbi:MAG: hypothetical protein V4616_02810 [Bacteroidota bacterium]
MEHASSQKRWLAGILFLVSSWVYAADPALQRPLLFRKDVYVLKDLMVVLGQETGYKIAYDTKKISPGTKVTIGYSRLTPKQLLYILKQQTGIRYQLRKSYLILLPRLREGIVSPKRIIELEVPLRKGITIDTIVPEGSIILKKDTFSTSITDTLKPIFIPDSLLAADSVAVLALYRLLSRQTEKVYYSSVVNLVSGSPIRQENLRKSFLREQLMLEGGVTNTEIYYVSPILTGGLKFLHATGTIFNYRSSTYWRLGIGTAVPLTAHLQLRAAYSIGRPFRDSKTFNNIYVTIENDPVTGDSIIYHNDEYVMNVRSDWDNLSLLLKYDFSRNFGVVGGVTLNRVLSKYTINGSDGNAYSGTPAIPTSSIPEPLTSPLAKKAERPFNPFSPTRQSWLGFQLSILYNF